MVPGTVEGGGCIDEQFRKGEDLSAVNQVPACPSTVSS